MNARALPVFLAIAAGLAAFVVIFDPAPLVWMGVGAAAWFAWYGFDTWSGQKGPRAQFERAKEAWILTTGGQAEGPKSIVFRDGDQPARALFKRRAGVQRVRIQTTIGDTALALRVWPALLTEGPSLDPDDADVGGPPVSRAPLIESTRFAGRLRVETNEPDRADRILQGHTAMALSEAVRDAGDAFRGITYDGHLLSVIVGGELAADPERAMTLVRSLWDGFGAPPSGPATERAILS